MPSSSWWAPSTSWFEPSAASPIRSWIVPRLTKSLSADWAPIVWLSVAWTRCMTDSRIVPAVPPLASLYWTSSGALTGWSVATVATEREKSAGTVSDAKYVPSSTPFAASCALTRSQSTDGVLTSLSTNCVPASIGVPSCAAAGRSSLTSATFMWSMFSVGFQNDQRNIPP